MKHTKGKTPTERSAAIQAAVHVSSLRLAIEMRPKKLCVTTEAACSMADHATSIGALLAKQALWS
jgi:hypothetical protein